MTFPQLKNKRMKWGMENVYKIEALLCYMKILIGCPTYERYEYCIDQWVKAARQIIKSTKEHQTDYLLVDNSKTDDFYLRSKSKGINIEKIPYSENVKQRLVDSRNLLREKALKGGYDYFFSLEQDVIPCKDVLKQLIKDDKDIISAYYSKPIGATVQEKETGKISEVVLEIPLIYLQTDGGVRRACPPEIVNKGIIPVGAFGVGCVLIKREVLEKIKFRFEEGKPAFDDFLFCHDAKRAGYALFLDLDIRAEHLHVPWTDVERKS